MGYEVIAIGASWGGLNAVGTLLEGIPAELQQAIVVAQHRSAQSRRVVCEPGDKQAIEPQHVYVAPPDYHLLVDDGRFALSLEERVQYARPSIDVLFESVAHAYRERIVQGKELVPPLDDLDHAANFLNMVNGKVPSEAMREWRPSLQPRSQTRFLDRRATALRTRLSLASTSSSR